MTNDAQAPSFQPGRNAGFFLYPVLMTNGTINAKTMPPNTKISAIVKGILFLFIVLSIFSPGRRTLRSLAPDFNPWAGY
jgi:hypothetical protein